MLLMVKKTLEAEYVMQYIDMLKQIIIMIKTLRATLLNHHTLCI